MTPDTPDLSNFSLLDIFCLEVETQMALLNDNLLAIERQPNADAATTAKRLEALMRGAHSIKGAARIVGLDLAVGVAHTMEDCFVAAQNGELSITPAAVDVLLNGVDWFAQLQQLSANELAPWLDSQADEIAQLQTAIAALLTETPASSSVVPAAAVPASSPSSPPAPAAPAAPPSSLPAAVPAPAAIAAEPASPPETIAGDRTVRVSVDNLNQLMALAGEAVVEANWLQPFMDSLLQLRQENQHLLRALETIQQETALPESAAQQLQVISHQAQDSQQVLGDRLGHLEQFSQRFHQLSDSLYREVIASHMRPFADGVQGFRRMVRDLAKQAGKQICLDIVGATTQVDRDILDQLEAPLTHMLRNAIAHGIEFPTDRQAAGKPAEGCITIEASHRAGMLSITISDDGRGIDLEQLRQSVVQKGLTTAALAAHLSDTELLEFLFLPGFSTASQVNEIAGRGVGLDIAKSMVQEVGGLLRVSSQLGQGTRFHFQLPLTLSVIRALLVEIAGEPYAFGLTRIDQVLMVPQSDVQVSENHPYIVLDDANVSLVTAPQVLELPESAAPQQSCLPVVILSDQTHRYGLVVDRFLGERDLVVRPLDPRLGKVQDISAAAVTEDGLPLLIIDVADLVRSIDQLVSGGQLQWSQQSVNATATRQQRVLVVDDSITVREMERKLLQNRGYHVDVAVNGMEGWNTVRTGNYDLVISDIDMPRMNGIELVRNIKNHPQLHTLPVIIVSYKDRQADQLAGLEVGADYYLTKSSFHDNSLLNAVTDLIGVSG
ncbi:MAG: hybrid sensor histidine kinase/response regulator [Leptolyngbya sp. SIOISBB]|nr:hybrid sensor histidine kinase/response regulator [Leptolyngbya sp. SIOISBB]